MELLDIYDGQRNKTGRTKARGSAFAPGEYCLVAAVCIFNEKGELLIQQRQTSKAVWPNLWDISACGGAMAGETSQQAAMRETREELGLNLSLDGVRPNLSLSQFIGFTDVYLVEQPGLSLATVRCQPEEVQAVRWATREEVTAMLKKGTFVHYYESLIHMLYEMHGSYDYFSL